MLNRRALLRFVLALHGTPMVGTIAVATMFAVPRAASAADDGAIVGTVTHSKTKEKLRGALVVLQCSCLPKTRETQTNDAGLYAFKNLPPGTYTLQVFVGTAEGVSTVTLPRAGKTSANFPVDPEFSGPIKLHIGPPVKQTTTVGRDFKMKDWEHIAIGGTDRDFTAVVESSATAAKDAAGISLGGMPSVESKLMVEGANANNPRFGTVGVSLVQELMEEVEVLEAGYDAEYGDAAAGQVTAWRISGTNKLRGQARFTYTPRLAQPRFILDTDNALRAVEVPDYQLQSVVVVSGPIIKDRLFWTASVVATGGRGSLIQSFYHRIDKDGSGGYQDCPHENGAFDCAEGGNYIATRKFAEQKFKTGGVALQFSGGLDWAISPKHRLRASFVSTPGFIRRSYRRPLDTDTLDPSSFGTNLAVAPLGGGSRIANGLVNRKFGWDRRNTTIVNLGYNGRVADDKLEIDANFSYVEFTNVEAWKVDDPELKNQVAIQKSDAQGANLFKLLDEETDALHLVPDVELKCNSRDLPPGLTCPVRQWLSGGIGQYSTTRDRRVGGNFALTHFFNAAGAHQLKYGAQVEHLRSANDDRYSGQNAADFYKNCPVKHAGGGEYCYDPENDAYKIDFSQRVDNHRFIDVSTDNPDARTSYGYGRVRAEQQDLRAIATAKGAGVRVASWNAKVTSQNYGMFLQDRWAILSNLFVSAGVRWEMQDIRDVFGRRAAFIWDNVAPRVGLNYDWTDEGRSRLFASYGWFYQPLPLSLGSRVFGGLVNVQRSYKQSSCVGQTVTINGVTRDRYGDDGPTEYCTDTNQATGSLTEGAVVPRLKGQYNRQFQIGYEQEIIEDLTFGVRWLHTDLGRAVEDVSTNGGNNFIIANPGVGVSKDDLREQQQACAELDEAYNETAMDDAGRLDLQRARSRCDFLLDAFTKVGPMFTPPRRNFDAFTFEVKKRFAKNWMVLASYTYSRMVGNYDGFVDPISGSINLGASTQYDLPELVRNSFGPLSNNIPHRVKLDGVYSFDLKEAGRLTVGTSFRYQSGYPISLRAGDRRYPTAFPIYVLPRGSGGRVEGNYNLNLSLAYTYPLPGRQGKGGKPGRQDLELEVAARWLNVTNTKAALRVDEVYSFSPTRPVAGGDLSDVKHVKIQDQSRPDDFFQRTILPRQGNYGVRAAFQNPTAAQFEVRLRF